jgi:hypothetical protein
VQFVLLLHHPDRAKGVRQSFGPFNDTTTAESARDELMLWPALAGAASAEQWEIQPLHYAPGAGVAPGAPQPSIYPVPYPVPYAVPVQAPNPTPGWWQNPVICQSETVRTFTATPAACAPSAATVTWNLPT